jgi:hypothetical protein
MTNEPYISAGHKVADIPVRISYRIIELFSAGLYSSPNKAIEELVSNSYDALASHVDLLLPGNLRDPDAAIWLVDDGCGMDVGGLFDLWQIARTTKRQGPPGPREPIGKFGIGKLATYVLARRLTHLSLRDGIVRAVTMDYGEIDPEAASESAVQLSVRELTQVDLSEALSPMATLEGGAVVRDRLISTSVSGSWTAAVMSRGCPARRGIWLSEGLQRLLMIRVSWSRLQPPRCAAHV